MTKRIATKRSLAKAALAASDFPTSWYANGMDSRAYILRLGAALEEVLDENDNLKVSLANAQRALARRADLDLAPVQKIERLLEVAPRPIDNYFDKEESL